MRRVLSLALLVAATGAVAQDSVMVATTDYEQLVRSLESCEESLLGHKEQIQDLQTYRARCDELRAFIDESLLTEAERAGAHGDEALALRQQRIENLQTTVEILQTQCDSCHALLDSVMLHYREAVEASTEPVISFGPLHVVITLAALALGVILGTAL